MAAGDLFENVSEGDTHSNSSKYNDHGETAAMFIMEPFVMMIVRLSMFGVVFITAVIGNVIVFTAPWRNRRLRTFSYYLITTLAISDFISVLGMPLIVASGELGSWIFGEFLCRSINPTQVICSMLTTNVHMAIAVDRYRAVTNPFRIKPSGYRTVLVIALLSLFSLLCALPAFGARKLISYEVGLHGEVYHFCYEKFPVKPVLYQQIYTVFLFLVNYFIPITVMFCLYARVLITLRNSDIRKQRSVAWKPSTATRKKSAGATPVKRSTAARTESSSSSQSGSMRRHTAVEKKFIKMIFLVLGIFILCYLPYQVFFLLVDFASETIQNWRYKFIANNVIFFVTWLPNAINPVCYNAMDRYYKRAFRVIFNICRRARRNAYGNNVFDSAPSGSSVRSAVRRRRDSIV